MGALEVRLSDINERLAASSVNAESLARLLRRREAILETADDVRERLEGATDRVQQVEAEIRASPTLFRYALHRRRVEGFLERSRREGFIAAAMYLVLEHELSALDEELNDLEGRIRGLTGREVKHRMLVEWRDELLMSLGPGRLTAAEHALERVSAAVSVASRAEDVRLIVEARDVALRAQVDLDEARETLAREGRLEKDDLAALADLIPEGTRHFSLRESKRRVEQATLRLGFIHDELRSIEGLSVQVRHPYFAMEGFLAGLFDDFHTSGLPVGAQAAVEEASSYMGLVLQALDGARAAAEGNLEGARAAESQFVGRAVAMLRPTPIRLTARYSKWDPAPLPR